MTSSTTTTGKVSVRAEEAQNRAYYDDFSKQYERERHDGYHALIDELEMRVMAPLVRDKKVLEVGCGTGLILQRLAKIAREAEGVDLSEGMVEHAKKRGLKVQLGSATHLPYPDDSFDCVCSFKVLAHVPDIGKALSEMVRVSKPNGYIVAEFYNAWSLRYLAKRIAGPQAISAERTEADVYTRWDSPTIIPRLIPANAELLDFQGVRIVTPVAWVHKLPIAKHMFRHAEKQTMRTPLRYFGGFLLAVLRKQS